MHGKGMKNIIVTSKFKEKEAEVDKEKDIGWRLQMPGCKIQQRHIQGCA
jgi:hypothetical protein